MTKEQAVAQVNAAADANMTILRAQGLMISKDPVCEGLFRLAFSCGANWAVNLKREQA